jgi:hypothetical protein
MLIRPRTEMTCQLTNLIIQTRVYLRCCLVHNDDVSFSQDRSSECNQLPFSCTERTALADWHLKGEATSFNRPTEQPCQVTPLQHIPALLVSMLLEWIKVTSECTGK